MISLEQASATSQKHNNQKIGSRWGVGGWRGKRLKGGGPKKKLQHVLRYNKRDFQIRKWEYPQKNIPFCFHNLGNFTQIQTNTKIIHITETQPTPRIPRAYEITIIKAPPRKTSAPPRKADLNNAKGNEIKTLDW